MSSFISKRTQFLSVLNNKDYRLYYFGLLISVSGYQMLLFTLAWAAFEITGDVFSLGLVAASQAIPSLILNLFGGALADRWNQRFLIIAGETAAAILVAALGIIVFFFTVQLWQIIVISSLIAVALGFDQPARRVIWSFMVTKDQFAHAISLNQMVWNSTRIYAPGIAGALIASINSIYETATLGIAISLFVTSVSFLVMSASIFYVHLKPSEKSNGGNLIQEVFEGFRFVFKNSVFGYLLILSLAVGFFGLSFAILLPAFTVEYLGGGVGTVGILTTVIGIGGLLGAITVASFSFLQSKGLFLILTAIFSGLFISLFALFTATYGNLIVSLHLAAIVGFIVSAFSIANGTSINLLVPDNFRGRLVSLRSITYSLIPLGGLFLASLASFVGIRNAVLIAGITLILIAVGVYALSKNIRNLDFLVKQSKQSQS